MGAITAILGVGFSSQDGAGSSAGGSAGGATRPEAEAEGSLAKDMELVEMIMGFVEGQPEGLR